MRGAPTDEAFDALREQLGTSPPASLRELDRQHLEDLTESIQAARSRQAEALQDAGDRALRHVPRLLRGPVRRVVG